jgi:hypothetical protein
MTGQLPLAIAQLLINRVMALRTTSNNGATVMAPVLHTPTDASLALKTQQDPIFILGQISRRDSRAFPFPVLLFTLGAQQFERAMEIVGEGHLVGRH